VSDLSRAAALLAWDQETYMPAGGVAGRADQLATLHRLAHQRFTSDEVGRLLEELEGEAEESGWPYDSVDASLVRVTRRDFERQLKLPTDLVVAKARAAATSRATWARAREESDWAAFVPCLELTLELSRRTAEALGYPERPYDALIDRAEPGMTASMAAKMFEDLKAAIVPLVLAISERADLVDDSFLHGDFEESRQLAFALEVVRHLGYDLQRGRQDLSAHPFSISLSPGDVRITTRVDPGFLSQCLFGSIHESGHAMYSQGHSPALDRTPLWGGASDGVHESQSRLWENLVGRSRGFWRHFFPALQRTFPERLGGVDADAFYRAVNRVQPSYVRVEADELTYNLHILLRFEVEDAMLEGRLDPRDVPDAWNQKLKEYLGLPPPPVREGPLQDIHWSYPSLGEFIGYSVGNLIGAQLMERAREDLPDLDAAIEAGEFGGLLGWLRERVHGPGRMFTPTELVERVTGRPIGAEAWIAYATRKFGELYELPV
jgi:carboxypeptidase Taq